MTDEGYLQNKIRALKDEIEILEKTHEDISHKCERLQKQLDANSERLKQLDDIEKIKTDLKKELYAEINTKTDEVFKNQVGIINKIIKDANIMMDNNYTNFNKSATHNLDDLHAFADKIKAGIGTINTILVNKKIVTDDELVTIYRLVRSNKNNRIYYDLM